MYADYVPRAALSLSLVGEKLVSTVNEVIDYFGIFQDLYAFFSESPRWWEVLNVQVNLEFSLKSLSSAPYVVVWAIKNEYTVIFQTLKHILGDSEENVNEMRRSWNILF